MKHNYINNFQMRYLF